MSGARLAGVLRVRRLQECRARGEVAIDRRDHRLASTAEAMTWTRLDSTVPAAVPAPAAELRRARAVIEAGVLAAQRQHSRTTDAAARLAESGERWTVAARRVDGLERLATRLAAAEQAEEQRSAANAIDDLVLARWKGGRR